MSFMLSFYLISMLTQPTLRLTKTGFSSFILLCILDTSYKNKKDSADLLLSRTDI